MKSYQIILKIERFNDGKYKAERIIERDSDTSGYISREDLLSALDGFKQELIDFEESIDSE